MPFLAALTAAALSISAKPDNEVRDTLSTAVITGTRTALSQDVLPAPVSVISRRVIQESGENALLPAIMDEVPGLFVTSRGVTGYGVSNGAAGGISLRGFGAANGRVLILIDGHPQFEAIYGHPVADEYIAADAQRVEVVRGASSVLYGSNAMGGAINIITRKPESDGNKLNLRLSGGSYGTARGSLTDTYRKGRFSAVVSGNYDRTDGHRDNSAFNSGSGYARLGYELSDNWKIYGNASLIKSYSENPGTVESPMFEGTADILRGMSGISLDNSYDRTSGSVTLFYNWGDHEINDGYTAGGSPREYLFHGTDYMGGANIWQSYDIFRGNTLTGGFDAKLYGGNAYRNPVTEIYADHVKLHEFAGYLFDQHKAGKFLFNAGLRVENHKLYGTEVIPQFGISFSPEGGSAIKASVSKGFRTPNMRELYMYAVANEDLEPERVWSYDLTASKSLLDGRLKGEISLYYMKGSNIVEVVQVEGRRQNRNVGEFENSGVEASVNWRAADGLDLNANYSYTHMSVPITGAPEQKFYLGARYGAGRWTLSSGVMAVDGLYLSTGDSPVKENYVTLKARAAYSATDFLSIFVNGDNLTDSSYSTMLGFPEPGVTVLAGISINL